MKIRDFLYWAALAAAMGYAMAKGTGDTAVGIALGAGIASALPFGRRRRGAFCDLAGRRGE